MSVSWKKRVRLLVVGIALAVCALLINSYVGTTDDACAAGKCPHTCPHEACVSACWADGTVHTSECTKAEYSPIYPLYCDPPGGCRTRACQ